MNPHPPLRNVPNERAPSAVARQALIRPQKEMLDPQRRSGRFPLNQAICGPQGGTEGCGERDAPSGGPAVFRSTRPFTGTAGRRGVGGGTEGAERAVGPPPALHGGSAWPPLGAPRSDCLTASGGARSHRPTPGPRRGGTRARWEGIACSDRWWAYDYLDEERRQLDGVGAHLDGWVAAVLCMLAGREQCVACRL